MRVHSVPGAPAHKALALLLLLLLLLLRANEVVSSDELVDALWGERPPETAQTALHGHISALRKRLGAERIETRPPGDLLRLGPDDEVDVHRFERMTAQAYANGPLLRADKLREALALFRGEPLADFGYDSFAHGESHRLEELRLDALEERIEADLQLNRHVQMLPELERFGAGTARRRYEALRHRHVPARAGNWAWDGTYSFNPDD